MPGYKPVSYTHLDVYKRQGYYPISNGAYETQTMLDIYEEYPQLEVSAEQLRSSKVNSITAGPLLSQLPQLRTDLVAALESVFNGGSVEDAIAEAVRSTNAVSYTHLA